MQCQSWCAHSLLGRSECQGLYVCRLIVYWITDFMCFLLGIFLAFCKTHVCSFVLFHYAAIVNENFYYKFMLKAKSYAGNSKLMHRHVGCLYFSFSFPLLSGVKRFISLFQKYFFSYKQLKLGLKLEIFICCSKTCGFFVINFPLEKTNWIWLCV